MKVHTEKNLNVFWRLRHIIIMIGIILSMFPENNASADRLSASPRVVQSKIHFVHDTAVGKKDGSSWVDAFTDLQAAIDAAIVGDQIWVASGTYWPTLRTDASDPRSVTFSLLDGVKLYGGFTGDENTLEKRKWIENPTILSGDIDHNDTASPIKNLDQIIGENAYQVVTAGGLTADTLLDGFILTAGKADLATDVTGCSHECGGGLYVNGGNPAFANLLIRGNYAAFGGGVMLFRAGNSTLANITVQNNTAENGGGMGVYNSNPIVDQSAFSENSANNGGGFVIAKDSNVVLTNISVFNNVGNWGGGLFLVESSLNLVQATIVNNLASHGDNAYVLQKGQVHIKNSIIWGSDPDNAVIFGYGLTGLVATYNDILWPAGAVLPGEGNINVDPHIGKPGNYGGFTQTIPLLPGSPAVDAVPTDKCTQTDGITPLTTDQRGVSRPQGKACDMGAYEASFNFYFLPTFQ